MSNFIDIEKNSAKEVIPGFQGRFIHTAHMTISYWDIKKGSKLPEHHHIHEQISQVLMGEFQMSIDGESIVLKSGKVAIIPSNAVHSGIAITDCKVMDIFHPVREDYKI